MFNWLKRLFGIVTNKTEELLDRIEDPKVALNQILKDMNTSIQEDKLALGTTVVEGKRARHQQHSYEEDAKRYRSSAEPYMREGDQEHAKLMIRRAVEAERTAQNFKAAAEKLEFDSERLRDNIRSKEMKYKEARNTKHALLAQRLASKSLSRINGGYSAGSGADAFAEYDRLTEKIADQAVEAQTAFSMTSEFGNNDIMVVDASVDNEFEQLKKKFEGPLLEENKEVKAEK